MDDTSIHPRTSGTLAAKGKALELLRNAIDAASSCRITRVYPTHPAVLACGVRIPTPFARRALFGSDVAADEGGLAPKVSHHCR